MAKYTPTNWQDSLFDEEGNRVQKGTALSAANLNKIEQGVKAADDKVDVVQTEVSELPKRSEFDAVTQQLAEAAKQSDVDATNLRVDNLVIPLSPENANIEVTDAHTSLVKNKTFDTLSHRLESLEKDNYKPITNDVINGNFANGYVKWVPVNATVTETGGRIKIIASQTYGRLEQWVDTIVGHKYYYSAYVEGYNKAYLGAAGAYTHNTSGGLNRLSGIITATNTTTSILVGDSGAVGGSEIYADKFMLINLTKFFGAGNEPTVDDFNVFLTLTNKEYFEGSENFITNDVLYSLTKGKADANQVSDISNSVSGLSVDVSGLKTKVNGAQVSATKSKTFESVGGRIEEVEKDVFLPVVNLTRNGNKPVGTSKWIANNATVAETNNRLKVTATAKYGRIGQWVDLVVGHKYYFSANIEGSDGLYIMVNNEYVYNDKAGKSKVFGTTTAITDTSLLNISNSKSSDWVDFYVDKITLVDLTVLYGEGNEPNAETFSELIDTALPDGVNETANIASNTSLFKLLTKEDLEKDVPLSKIEGITQTKNNLDKNKIIHGYHLATSGAVIAGESAGNKLNCYTNYDKIEPNVEYYKNYIGTIIFYDENFARITTSVNSSPVAFVTPSNAVYYRTSLRASDVAFAQLEKGNKGTKYEKYGYYIKDLYTKDSVNLSHILDKPFTFTDVLQSLPTTTGISTVYDSATTRTELQLKSSGELVELKHFFNVSQPNTVQVKINAKTTVVGENIASVKIKYYRNGAMLYQVSPIYCVTSINQYKDHRFKFPIPEGIDAIEMFLYVSEGAEMRVRNYEVSMVTIPDTLPHPQGIKFVAHQGVPNYAPLNTMPSFELAKRAGYSGLIVNTGRTSDGHIVCLHDPTINATSNGTGNIRDMTLAQVRQFDFGVKRGVMYTGTEIPLLEDVLKFCAKTGMHPYIRLSGEFFNDDNGVYTDIYNMIKKYGLKDKVTFKAFEQYCLNSAHAVAGDNANYMYCVTNLTPEHVTYVKQFKNLRPESAVMEVMYQNITQSAVDMCKSEDIEIGAWIINSFMEMYRLVDMGVTEFTTDLLCLDGCAF